MIKTPDFCFTQILNPIVVNPDLFLHNYDMNDDEFNKDLRVYNEDYKLKNDGSVLERDHLSTTDLSN